MCLKNYQAEKQSGHCLLTIGDIPWIVGMCAMAVGSLAGGAEGWICHRVLVGTLLIAFWGV